MSAVRRIAVTSLTNQPVCILKLLSGRRHHANASLQSETVASFYLQWLWPLTPASCQSLSETCGILAAVCACDPPPGFADFAIQRASAAASSGRVTKQTAGGEDERLSHCAARCPFVSMHPTRFTDSNTAILTATPGLMATRFGVRLAKQGGANSEKQRALQMLLWEADVCGRQRRLATWWQAERADPVSAPVLRSNPAWYVSGSEQLCFTVAIRCQRSCTRQVHI